VTSKPKAKRKAVTVKRGGKLSPVAAACKPENPREARAWLRTIAEHIKETYEAYGAHEPPAPVAGDDVRSYAVARARRDQWLADRQRLWWFFRAVKVYGSKKNKKSFEQLLGLPAGQGHPVVQERRNEILQKLLDIILLLEPRGPTRKAPQGQPARPGWKTISAICGMTVPAAKNLYQRELSNFNEALAKGIAARLGQKPSRIGEAKARSAALGKEIAARNRRAPEAKTTTDRRVKSHRLTKSGK
jgi:hypothetical protein